ncbi:transaldolase family protein [Streptomyces sp. TR06-5]|uniref:transaldolase family protein n=1 Tax=unclassified Streptomyces TaxID=2593676 RepID=UPI00399F796F
MSTPSVLEHLQEAGSAAEVWWDSSPLDFPLWRRQFLATAPDEASRERWSAQLDRFLPADSSRPSLVRGVTTNPSLVAKSVLAQPTAWRDTTRKLIEQQARPDVESVFALVYQEALRRATAFMLPMWNATGGRFGWVSGQLDPRYMFDTDRMLEQALELAAINPNLMVKVPGTAQGYQVVRQLVARGISINGTLSYTVPQFTACSAAVTSGLAEAGRRGVDTSRWRAVFTHMIGRFGSNLDVQYEAAARGIELSQAETRWAELAIAKRIHHGIRDQRLPVKLLLSSLLADDPAQGATSLSMHLEQTAGGAVAYTCKPQFVADLMRRDDEATAFRSGAIDDEVPAAVLAKLLRLPSFHRAYDPDGMVPEEFAHYGAFVSTYVEVMQNTRNLIDFVARHVQEQAVPAAPLALSGTAV